MTQSPNTAWIKKTSHFDLGGAIFVRLSNFLYKWKACQNPVILIPNLWNSDKNIKIVGKRAYQGVSLSTAGRLDLPKEILSRSATLPNPWGTHSRSWKHCSPFPFNNYVYHQRKRKSSFPTRRVIL